MKVSAQIIIETDEGRPHIEHIIEEIEFRFTVADDKVEIIETDLFDTAPDLLEAIKAGLSFIENLLIDLGDTEEEIETHPIVKKITEAIAKADQK